MSRTFRGANPRQFNSLYAYTAARHWAGGSSDFHSMRPAKSSIPYQSLRDLLILSKDTEDRATDSTTAPKKKQTTAADFLTLMSQIILVGSTAFILFCAASPNTVSNQLEEYKDQIKRRRHARMVEFMTSDRTYINGDVGASDHLLPGSSLMFQGQIYHPDIAKDIRNVLFKGPTLRYGILTGPTGSGKSKLIRTLVKDEPHYAVLSMGLISGVKSLVDALSEEVGYDFDDWTERMLQGYLFNGNTITFPTQLDKLAFLLDEIEEACWKLKFDPELNNSLKRPVIVLDDIDRLDLTQHDLQQAFGFTPESGEIAKIVRPEVLGVAKVYKVSHLEQAEADRFLRDRLGVQHVEGGAADRLHIQNVVGTRVFDLMAVCEEVIKTGDSTDTVLKRRLDCATEDVWKTFSELEDALGEAKSRAAVRWMDSIAGVSVSSEQPTRHFFEDARRRGYGEAMNILLKRDIISREGIFSSDLYRNAYRRYRNMPMVYTPRVDKKQPWHDPFAVPGQSNGEKMALRPSLPCQIENIQNTLRTATTEMLSIASAGRRAASATIRLHPLAAAQSGWASSTRYVSTPSRQPTHAFSSTSVASNELPLKTLRDLLVLSKDVNGIDVQTPPVNGKKPTTAADFLTLMSQIILVGSTGFLLYCAVFPNQMSNMLENYKEQLTQRRHDRILEFMTSERPYLSGSVDRAAKNESGDSSTSSLMFHNEIYHTEVAGDIKKVLLQAPVLRYGILTGPTGSGKSRLIRTLVKEETHYAVLSMGLISGVKSLVDALSEEIGYDFDDWTERMLQGYLFNGSTVSFPTQLDKLAFLLDEFEEACWSLKFNAKNDPATTKSNVKRPVLVLDDIDLLDTSDKDTRQAVRMLFNSANKWAREDTALVVFTTGNASLMDETGEIAKIVRPEVLELAKVYNVGCLTPESADRFLMDRIGVYGGVKGTGFDAGDLERKKVQWVVGTKMFDLIKVCDELVKKDLSVDQVLHAQLSEAVADVRRAFDDVGNVVGERQMRSLCRWMDSIAQIPVSEAASKGHLFEEARRKGFGGAMKFLLGRDVVSSNGLFSSDLIRNAYCKYRNIPITYTPSIETKKSRGWFY
ncbi:hypothetical protein HDU81_000932 [Chytriomyces hyalinus]|nr:hypothetical protein HDU81_000932 [Chytriomyces hyalinus]